MRFLLILLASCATVPQEEGAPVEAPAEAPAEVPAEVPAEAPAEAPAETPAKAPYVETIPGTGVTFEMVHVPGLDLFFGKTEVTWDEFEAYYLTEETPEGVDAVARPTPSYHPHDQGWGAGRRPAVSISRQAAEKYCEWLSGKTGRTYRLPTEAEWEFACGPDPSPVEEFAWFGKEKTSEAGQKRPNRFGLHDMLGNAWEYCSGPEPVVRGGCWKDDAVGAGSRRVVPPEWNESDPQRPKSEWWLADAPWTGFRVVTR